MWIEKSSSAPSPAPKMGPANSSIFASSSFGVSTSAMTSSFCLVGSIRKAPEKRAESGGENGPRLWELHRLYLDDAAVLALHWPQVGQSLFRARCFHSRPADVFTEGARAI